MLKWFFTLPIHMRVAIVVTPILFILGWGGADYIYNSKPSTNPIRYSPLSLDNNCVLRDSACEWRLSAANFLILLRREASTQKDLVKLVLNAKQYLKGVELRLVDAAAQEHTIVMQRVNQDDNEWAGAFPSRLLDAQPITLRLALARTGEILYFEGEMQF